MGVLLILYTFQFQRVHISKNNNILREQSYRTILYIRVWRHLRMQFFLRVSGSSYLVVILQGDNGLK